MAVKSVSIPEELSKRMKAIDEINWSAIARKAFEQKVREIEEERVAWRRHSQEQTVKRGWSEAHELFEL